MECEESIRLTILDIEDVASKQATTSLELNRIVEEGLTLKRCHRGEIDKLLKHVTIVSLYLSQFF